MNLIGLSNLVRNSAKSHSSVILSCVAGVGVLSSPFLASKATVEAVDLIRAEENLHIRTTDRNERYRENVRLVWKLYIPTAVSATTTVVCIVGANRIQANKTLAAQAAYAFSERAYSEYRGKVVEEYGESKDISIRDSIAEAKVKETPPSIIAGSGKVLCCEATMRYFEADIESLRRAENQINAKMLSNDYATLDDFYHILRLVRNQII